MLHPRAPDHEIAAVAQHMTGRVRACVGAIGRRPGAAISSDDLKAQLRSIANACGARPLDERIELQGQIARMVDASWWARNLRRGLLRENEAIEFAQGRIRRREQCYVTDHAMSSMQRRAKATREMLEGLEVASGDGEAFNLADVYDATVSNPALRRSELMVRCRGFEEMSESRGDVAVFLTITCPSRFHRFAASGGLNKKWDGSTPKAAQDYLCTIWRRLTQAWKRRGYYPYGFRVAEPHHDGCPHWHILLFAPPEQMGWFKPERVLSGAGVAGVGIIGIAGIYALKDTPEERGAVASRYTAKPIDKAKGEAAGYIAKYISKNIDGLREDGEGVGLDYASGTNAEKAARRVRTWASTWGIRQFQQVGGPSVTVWRELRRLDSLEGMLPLQQLDLFELPRSAADRSMWALFWLLQGGPDVRRRKLTLKPVYAKGTSQKYGDEVQAVRGVWHADGGLTLITRIKEWTVQRAGLAETNALQDTWSHDILPARRGAEKWARAHGFDSAQHWRESDSQRREATPWTGVNNCTPPDQSDEAAALREDFLRSMRAMRPEIPPRVGYPDQLEGASP